MMLMNIILLLILTFAAGYNIAKTNAVEWKELATTTSTKNGTSLRF